MLLTTPPQLHQTLLQILVAGHVCKIVYGKACLLCWRARHAARVLEREPEYSNRPNASGSCCKAAACWFSTTAQDP